MNPVAAVARVAKQLDSVAEARWLVAFVLDICQSRLPVADDLTEPQLADLAGLVARRRRGEPIQYLTGQAAFHTISVAVKPGVFIPRPETEVLVDWALANIPDSAVVVELGTGSGAIAKALAAAAPSWQIHAVELSDVAHDVAQKNLASTGVDLVCGDMATAFLALNGQVDLVISNPPYIPLEMYLAVAEDVRNHEPALALFSGADGLDAIRVVAEVAARLLKSGGAVAVEHAEVQLDSAQEVFLAAEVFTQIRNHKDLADRPRFVTARRR